MWKNQVSIDIAAPPEKVYRYLADLTKHSEWSMSVTKIEQVTPGAVGIGTQFKASEVIPSKLVSFATITALDEPARVAWQSTDYKVFCTNWEFVLSVKNGGTHLEQSVVFDTVGLLGKLLLPLRKIQMPPENLKSLNRIKQIMEN